MVTYKLSIPLLIFMVLALCRCAVFTPYGGSAHEILSEEEIEQWQMLVTGEVPWEKNQLTIQHPYDGAVFPPEISSPEFRWTDRSAGVEKWLIAILFPEGGEGIYVISHIPSWTPDRETWEAVKAGSVSCPAQITVYGVLRDPEGELVSRGSISLSTSKDPVNASVFYRQVPLPFEAGKEGIRKMKWRLGDISSYDQPAVVMENMTICAGCHMFARDSSLISMEMNYKNDSGAHLIAPVKKTVELSRENFITWKDFPGPDMLPATRGLFAKLSPGGKYLAGTVNEISFFTLTGDPAFSQLFFPTYGILAWYDVDDREFHSLPGGDDIKFVQTDPAWSPDERYIVFSRAGVRNEYHEDITRIRIRSEDADIKTLNMRYPIRFDLYRIPFNRGKGGTAVPLEGASCNGMSNYFARYSPDGRWIVFTRSRSGIMLQPDSELYIIPAEGGQARRMKCNRHRFNSWHSFSANGRWMLFSSKANSKFTEIFLTHIDENGMDSPPVCLSRFSKNGYAANMPEFIDLQAEAMEKIVLTGR